MKNKINKLIAIAIVAGSLISGNKAWGQWSFTVSQRQSGNCTSYGNVQIVVYDYIGNMPLTGFPTKESCEQVRSILSGIRETYGNCVLYLHCTSCTGSDIITSQPNAPNYSKSNINGTSTGQPFITSHPAFETVDFIDQTQAQYNLLNSRGHATYYNGINVTGDKNFDNEWSKLNGRGSGYFDFSDQNNARQTEPYQPKKGFDAMAELGKSSGVNLSDYISEADYNKNPANMTSQEITDWNKKIDKYVSDANVAINAKIQKDLEDSPSLSALKEASEGENFTFDSKTSSNVIDLSDVDNLGNMHPRIFEQPSVPDMPRTNDIQYEYQMRAIIAEQNRINRYCEKYPSDRGYYQKRKEELQKELEDAIGELSKYKSQEEVNKLISKIDNQHKERSWADKTEEITNERSRRLVEQLQNGEITPSEFERQSNMLLGQKAAAELARTTTNAYEWVKDNKDILVNGSIDIAEIGAHVAATWAGKIAAPETFGASLAAELLLHTGISTLANLARETFNDDGTKSTGTMVVNSFAGGIISTAGGKMIDYGASNVMSKVAWQPIKNFNKNGSASEVLDAFITGGKIGTGLKFNNEKE